MAVDNKGGVSKPKPKPAAKPTAATPAGGTRAQFATSVLQQLGYPTTTQNINFLVAWAQREGGGGANNPLNTTQSAAGATNLAGNSAGVKNYPSLAVGAAATVQTLQNGNYNDILNAMSTGQANASANYSGLSTWSGGGYSTLAGVPAKNATVATTAGGNAIPVGAVSNSDQLGTETGAAAQNPDGADSGLAGENGVWNYADQNYGYLGAFVNDPTIGPILRTAAAQGWDTDKLYAALYKTPFWQHTTASARQFDAQGKLDPATQQQAVANQVAKVQALAGSEGITLNAKRAQSLATDSLRFGWSDDLLKQGVASEFKYNPNNPTGVNATTQALKATASQYLVPISDAALGTWATKILGGTATSQDFTAYAAQQAKSLFPSLSSAIDAGVDPSTYVDPYKQLAAQTLGVNENSVNFLDPKWQKAINQIDPKTGVRTAMNLSDWQKTLMTDPTYGYDQTTTAKQQSSTNAASFLSSIGFAGS